MNALSENRILIVNVLQRAGTIPALTLIAFCLDLLVLRLKFIEFQIAQILNIDHLIARLINGANELVELQIDRPGVAILCVLYQKNPEEGDDGCAGINDELLCVGVVKDWTQCSPNNDDQARSGKCPLRSQPA